jgi:hypothetical protein
MKDADIQGHIEALVAEEHRLLDSAAARPLEPAEHARLNEVNVALDRYYDLLRQRRAREEFGQDPAAAHIRAEETVEKYLQ